ncbi:hypothetical protein PIB30_111454, partial [Stylosanthes scabra]|nr:hypothetical protein [Stylosanthes scabra]
SRILLDSASGGSLSTKTQEEAKNLIELVAQNQYMYSSPSERSVKRGVLEVETVDAILAQNKAMAQQDSSLINSLLYHLSQFRSKANLILLKLL